jgi:hypothetical protein
MEVWDGTPCFGPVVEMGNADLKWIYGMRDKYETCGGGTGTIKIYVRGSADWFLRNDGSPAWAEYTAPLHESWRYVQWKLEYVSGV